MHATAEAACAIILKCATLGVRCPCYQSHSRPHEMVRAEQCLTMSAAKTSPEAPSPSDAPMPRAFTVTCLMASRGGGGRAQQALPARDTHPRDWHCASSSGTCRQPQNSIKPLRLPCRTWEYLLKHACCIHP